MDPYLESHWRDLQTRLIVYVTDQIHERLAAPPRARVGERFVVEASELEDRDIFPDARGVESKAGGGT